MSASTDAAFLVIDPQKAFCDAAGSLARSFGRAEIQIIEQRLDAIERALRDCRRPDRVMLIRSEYQSGQFTAGDLRHPFANVCVRDGSPDCDWSLSAEALAGKHVYTKQRESALTSMEIRKAIRSRQESGLKQIFVFGFLTTHCVKQTALDLRRFVYQDVEIILLEGLCGSRASKYLHDDEAPQSAHMDALKAMESNGITVRYSNVLPEC